MTADPSTTRTRRAVLGAAIGGAAAVAATSIRPLAANAVEPPVLLGVANTATTPTSVENTDPGEVSLAGTSASGTGIKGVSTDSTESTFPDNSYRTGVYGTVGDTSLASVNTDETGTYGYSDVSFGSAGVWGESVQGIGVVGSGDWAVYGLAGSAGVVGDATSAGVGVVGFSGDTQLPALPAGVGVFAAAGSTTQTALQVSGKVKFSRSGRVSSTSTATYKKVTMSGVTSSSYVIATLQTSVTGCYVRAVVPTTGSFTIYLSKAPGKAVYIGYMVIN
jgi:hypothetical protein